MDECQRYKQKPQLLKLMLQNVKSSLNTSLHRLLSIIAWSSFHHCLILHLQSFLSAINFSILLHIFYTSHSNFSPLSLDIASFSFTFISYYICTSTNFLFEYFSFICNPLILAFNSLISLILTPYSSINSFLSLFTTSRQSFSLLISFINSLSILIS